MKQILITTDLSEAAAAAYPVAREQARAYGPQGCHLTLLYAAEDILAATFDFPLWEDPESVLQELENQAREALGNIEAQHFSDLLISTLVLRAKKPIPEEIVEYSRSHHIDLIITATHGRSGISHLFHGSVAERLLRTAACPVLVVPSRGKSSAAEPSENESETRNS